MSGKNTPKLMKKTPLGPTDIEAGNPKLTKKTENKYYSIFFKNYWPIIPLTIGVILFGLYAGGIL